MQVNTENGKDEQLSIAERIGQFLNNAEHGLTISYRYVRIGWLCRKHQVSKKNFSQYWAIEKQLINSTYAEEIADNQNTKQIPIEAALYVMAIKGRLSDLHKQFLHAIHKKHVLSIAALNRYLVDLYFRTLYIRLNPKKISAITSAGDNLPRPREMWKDIEAKGKIDYLEFDEKYSLAKHLEQTKNDLAFYSEIMHPTHKSFQRNIGILIRDKTGAKAIPFSESALKSIDLKTHTAAIYCITNGIPLTSEDERRFIHHGFEYLYFVLKELDALEDFIKP